MPAKRKPNQIRAVNQHGVKVVTVLDPDMFSLVKEVLLLLKMVDARTRVLFEKVHNMQIDLQQLQKENRQLIEIFQSSYAQGSIEHTEAQRIVHEFLFPKGQTIQGIHIQKGT